MSRVNTCPAISAIFAVNSQPSEIPQEGEHLPSSQPKSMMEWNSRQAKKRGIKITSLLCSEALSIALCEAPPI